jgi:hypothetical protein
MNGFSRHRGARSEERGAQFHHCDEDVRDQFAPDFGGQCLVHALSMPDSTVHLKDGDEALLQAICSLSGALAAQGGQTKAKSART